MINSVDVIAHRGLHTTRPENSPAAVAAALSAGFTLVEVDVRTSRDGALFVLHDNTLERTTNLGGRLASLTAAQAGRARIADGSPLPRLEPLLDLCAGRAVLCLDVKDARAIDPLMRLLHGREDDVEIWTSLPALVRRSAEAGIRTTMISHGLMPRGVGDLIWTACDLGASGLSFYPADLEPHVAAACRNAGIAFLCGTPNDPLTWRYLLDAGGRGIITDRPLACRSWLAHANSGDAPISERPAHYQDRARLPASAV